MKRYFLNLCMFVLTAFTAASANPRIVAHRGMHLDGASENSLMALQKAMDANCYGIELDVWLTADGVPVVHHDGFVDSIVIRDRKYVELDGIRLSNGEAIPTLAEYLDVFKNGMGDCSSKLIVEIKTHPEAERTLAAADSAMQMITAADLDDRCEYIAFSYDACRHIASARPEAMVGYLSGDKTPAEVSADGIRSIDYNYHTLDKHPEWIDEAKKLGMVVNVWTVNKPEDLLRYIPLADYITTDAPDVLKRMLDEQ